MAQSGCEWLLSEFICLGSVCVFIHVYKYVNLSLCVWFPFTIPNPVINLGNWVSPPVARLGALHYHPKTIYLALFNQVSEMFVMMFCQRSKHFSSYIPDLQNPKRRDILPFW